MLRLRSPVFGTTRPRAWTQESPSGRLHGESVPAGWSPRYVPLADEEPSRSEVEADIYASSASHPMTPGGVSAPFHPNAPLTPTTPTSSMADGRWPSQQRAAPKNNASHLPSRLFMTGVAPSTSARPPTFKAHLASQRAEKLYSDFLLSHEQGKASHRDAPRSAPQRVRSEKGSAPTPPASAF